MIRQKSPILRDMLLLGLVFGTLFFSFLGNRPLTAPDEGRYVEIPREMIATGDYITPHLNGLKYFEKPPLLYWVQTLPLKMIGMQEWAMRLPLAIFALLGCLMTYFFTQRLYSRSTGLWAASILGSALLYNSLARIITLDMGFSILMTLTLFSFLSAANEPNPTKRRLFMYLSATACASAVLAKGLIGLVLPSMIIGLWLTLTHQWQRLRWLFIPSSLLLFLALSLPWHIMASLKTPEFFDFYIVHEHFTRYLTSVHRRYQPFWFFMPIIFLGLLPWSSFLFRPFKAMLPKSLKDCRDHPKDLFFLLWVVLPFFFFSLSSSKLIPYILPIFPALAVIIGYFIRNQLSEGKSFKGEIFGYSALCLFLMAAVTYTLVTLDPTLQEPFRPFLWPLYLVLGVSATVPPILRLWKGERLALYGTLVCGISFVVLLIHASSNLQQTSMKPLAQKFLKTMPKDTQVFTYGGYYQDLPPYLDRTVQIVNWYGELEFGAKIDPAQTQIISHQYFEKAWKSAAPVCTFVRQDRYRDLTQLPWFTPTLLGEHDGHMLACNTVPSFLSTT
jgi:4-amino-4-deoxy-L-arabinose transferase-like glycosyltransferase